MRDYLASQPGEEYTEDEKETKKFWERFLNGDSFYSPYDDLVESIRARNEREKRAKMAAEHLCCSTFYACCCSVFR